MGDSGVSCVLTGVSMNYEKVALIALAPQHFVMPSRKHSSYGHGVTANEDLRPFLLPIFGRLDGYGYLEDIERDEHAEFLEGKFGMSIKGIANAIALGDTPSYTAKLSRIVGAHRLGNEFKKNVTWDGRLSGCYVHRAAYDHFSRVFIDEFGDEAFSVWDAYNLSPEVLEGLGFSFQRSDQDLAKARLKCSDSEARNFRYLYTSPELPNVEAWSDNGSSAIFAYNKVPFAQAKTPKQVHDQLSELLSCDGLPPERVKWALNASAREIELASLHKRYTQRLERDREYRKLAQEQPHTLLHLVRRTPTERVYCDSRKHVDVDEASGEPKKELLKCPTGFYASCAKYSGRRVFDYEYLDPELVPKVKALGWKPFTRTLKYKRDMGWLTSLPPETLELYGSRLTGKYRERSAALANFMASALATNRILQPTARGYQYGNLPMQYELAKFTVALLERRRNEQNEVK